MSSEPTLHGADLDTVQRAVDTADPLVGTQEGHEGCRGFAGVLPHPDGRPTYVRDVLGRYPLFVERERPTEWAFSAADLEDPMAVPAGHVATPEGERLLADGVWTLPEHADPTDPYWDGVGPFADRETAVAGLEATLEGAFAAVEGSPAVAFSGGVDSALVAAALGGPCYVAGFDGSHDIEAARSAADAMGLDLRVVEVTHDDIERAAREVARATGRTNAMDVSIAVPLYLVGERAAEDGHETLALGQGADELFGGYEKLLDPAEDHRIEADTVRGGARETMLGLPGGLERDVLALRAAGVEPVCPLLDDRVVRAALRLPSSLLVAGERRKVAFREATGAWVPDAVADRDKKAVQYGSLVSRELDRLARQAGYKRRMDDHVGRYVRSLL